jgi:hypothetical protein
MTPERQRQLDKLRREIQPALDRLDRGEGRVLDVEAIKAEGRRRLSQNQGAVYNRRRPAISDVHPGVDE